MLCLLRACDLRGSAAEEAMTPTEGWLCTRTTRRTLLSMRADDQFVVKCLQLRGPIGELYDRPSAIWRMMFEEPEPPTNTGCRL